MDEVLDNDRHIIEEIRSGQTRRYAVLIDRHKDRAMTLALRLTGNRQESEELVQDAFLRAYRSLDQFRGDAKFGTWFYRILYNLCLTKVSRRKGRPEQLDVSDERMLDNILVDEEEATIQERMEEDEMQQMIASEIAGMPEKFRTVLTLFYVQEMSYEEITAVLNQPLGTVKTNLFRARNLLRERVLAGMKGEMKVA